MKDKTLKHLIKIHNAVAEAINEAVGEQSLASSEPEDFDRPPILPCIRLLPNGGTEMYNCKTGEVIP